MGDKLWSSPFKYKPQSKEPTGEHTANQNQMEDALWEVSANCFGKTEIKDQQNLQRGGDYFKIHCSAGEEESIHMQRGSHTSRNESEA